MSVIVIKVGGSLLKTKLLGELCTQLGNIGKNHKVLFIPGGGIFADAVRDSTQSFNLDQDTSHWMAILSMNQYGYLLSSLIPGTICFENIDDAINCAVKYQPAVLLPYKLMKDKDPLPHSWDITSDSIAAWIAGYIKAERLVLVKSTSMPAGAGDKNDYRLPVDLEKLKGRDIVDPFFYKIMKGIREQSENISQSIREDFTSISNLPLKSRVWIISGNYPEQLDDLFENFKIT
jgi:aspartokinase-like uncharacterized kinase